MKWGRLVTRFAFVFLLQGSLACRSKVDITIERKVQEESPQPPEQRPPGDAPTENHNDERAPGERPPEAANAWDATGVIQAERVFYQSRSTIELRIAADALTAVETLRLVNLTTNAVLVQGDLTDLRGASAADFDVQETDDGDLRIRLYRSTPLMREALVYGENRIQAIRDDEPRDEAASVAIFLRDFPVFSLMPTAPANPQSKGRLRGWLNRVSTSQVRSTTGVLLQSAPTASNW